MLILSRRKGEAVCIGDDILVSIAEIKGNKVRLAIKAPPSVRVDREEVRRRRLEFESTAQTADGSESVSCLGAPAL